MGTRLDAVKRLHEHRRWVRGRLLTAARGLTPDALRKPFEMGLGSLLGTFVHMYGAEHVWISVLEGGDQALVFPTVDTFPNLAALERAWEPVDRRWTAWLGGAGESSLDAVAVRIREGKAMSTSVMDVLIHVATHHQYHAAQAANMLRHLGVAPPPACDFIVMAREQFLAGRK